MTPKTQSSIRFSDQQLKTLAKLQNKLQLDRANVIRLAIQRLAENEGIK